MKPLYSMMPKALKMKALSLAVIVSFTAGCDFSRTEAEYLDKAKVHYSKKQRNAAIIELKNALQLNINNIEARVLLADIYLNQGNFITAEKEYMRAGELGADSEKVNIGLIQSMIGQGNSKKALEVIAVKESDNPESKAILSYFRGKAQLNIGNFDKARKEFQNSISNNSASPYAMLSQAVTAYMAKRFEEANAWIIKSENAGLMEAMELDVVRADIALAQNDYVNAESYLKNVAKYQPFNFPIKIVLAWSLINQDKDEEANQIVDGFLKAIPNHPIANYLKSMLAYKNKDYEAAKTYSESALAATPEYLSGRLIAGASNYAVSNYEQANEHLKIYVGVKPDYLPARKLLAATQLKLGFVTDATKSLGDVDAVSLNETALLDAIGIASVTSGDVETGKTYLEKVSKLLPKSAPARARLGIAKISSGEIDEGIADLEEAVRLDSNFKEADIAIVLTYLRTRKFDEAMERAVSIQNKHPGSPHGFTLAGIVHSAQGRIEQAVDGYKKALSIAPGDVSANSNMAAIQLNKGDAVSARQYLLNALNENKGNLSLYIRLAQLEFQLKNEIKAIEYLDKAIEFNPVAVQPRVMLGNYYLDNQQPLKALEATSKLLDRVEDVNILSIVGRAQLQLGRADNAAITFKQLVQLSPDSPDAHWNLARAYMRSGSHTAADASLNTALALEPNHKPSLYLRVRLYIATGKIDKAKTALETLRKDEPDNTFVHELDAIVAFIEQDYTKSVAAYKRALVKRNTNYLTIRMAMAMRRGGNKEEANTLLSDWLIKYPDDHVTRKAYADALLLENKYELARNEFDKIIVNDNGNVAVLNNLAWVNMKLNSLDKALDYIGQARQKAPSNPVIIDTHASILIQKGDYKQALALLRDISQKSPNNNDIQYHLAQALSGVGKKQEAIAILKKITGPKSSFLEKDNALKLLSRIQ